MKTKISKLTNGLLFILLVLFVFPNAVFAVCKNPEQVNVNNGNGINTNTHYIPQYVTDYAREQCSMMPNTNQGVNWINSSFSDSSLEYVNSNTLSGKINVASWGSIYGCGTKSINNPRVTVGFMSLIRKIL